MLKPTAPWSADALYDPVLPPTGGLPVTAGAARHGRDRHGAHESSRRSFKVPTISAARPITRDAWQTRRERQ